MAFRDDVDAQRLRAEALADKNRDLEEENARLRENLAKAEGTARSQQQTELALSGLAEQVRQSAVAKREQSTAKLSKHQEEQAAIDGSVADRVSVREDEEGVHITVGVQSLWHYYRAKELNIVLGPMRFLVSGMGFLIAIPLDAIGASPVVIWSAMGAMLLLLLLLNWAQLKLSRPKRAQLFLARSGQFRLSREGGADRVGNGRTLQMRESSDFGLTNLSFGPSEKSEDLFVQLFDGGTGNVFRHLTRRDAEVVTSLVRVWLERCQATAGT